MPLLEVAGRPELYRFEDGWRGGAATLLWTQGRLIEIRIA
jgi:hypothetical protein